MKRSESREQALTFLFESSFGNNDFEEILNLAKSVREEKISNFSKELFEGTINNLESIDFYIEKHLKGWTKDRISKISISVLRLAIFEIVYKKDTPVDVCINEAVNLAKKYSTKEDASYINGVLSSVNKDVNNIS